MTTEEKLHQVTHDIVQRLQDRILPYMGYNPAKEDLRQVALDILNIDKAWQQLILEIREKFGLDLPKIKEPEKTNWDN